MSLAFNPFTGNLDEISNPATNTTQGTIELTGDLAGTASSPALVTIISGATVGDSTHIPVLTYDNKGRITAASTAIPSVVAPTQRTFAYFVS